MSDAPFPELETQLAELTTWHGPTPNLWKRACKLAGQTRGGQAGFERLLSRRVPGWVWPVGAAAVIFVTVGVWMSEVPSLSRSASTAVMRRGYAARGGRTPLVSEGQSAQVGDAVATLRKPMYGTYSGRSEADVDGDGAADFLLGANFHPQVDIPAADVVAVQTVAKYGEGPADPSSLRSGESSTDRQVIRKATIELAARDVRAAFLKAALLISEARGEFVQESTLTGSGDRLQANLTLRVAVDRLPEVLNELRKLGEVRSEAAAGEDVTTQVVDTEARLRNEQRVEAELLQLLEKRNDAPLKEIIELRDKIGQVRQSVEQLTAQRERLSRLIALATVLVLIRPADAPEPMQPGLAAYFVDAISKAWQKGVLFLVNTLAGVLSVAIGGLIWWALLLIAIFVVRAWRRHAVAKGT